MEDYGDILLVKNIVFRNGMADHASLCGRMCVKISNCENGIILLPLSHQKRNGKYIFTLSKEDLINKKKCIKYYPKDYIDMREMFKREIYYYDRVARLKAHKYYELLRQIILLGIVDNKYNLRFSDNIKNDLINQESELKYKLKK